MVCVSGGWAGVDSVWEQDSAEVLKILENAAESQPSAARRVGLRPDIVGYITLYKKQSDLAYIL